MDLVGMDHIMTSSYICAHTKHLMHKDSWMLRKFRAFLVSLNRAQGLWSSGFLRRAEGLCKAPCISEEEPSCAACALLQGNKKTPSKQSLGEFGFETFLEL